MKMKKQKFGQMSAAFEISTLKLFFAIFHENLRQKSIFSFETPTRTFSWKGLTKSSKKD